MNALLKNTAETIADAAGWKKPEADADGSFPFFLEGDLDFKLLTPDGKTGIFLARLADAPDAGSPQEGAELERIASLAAGVLKNRGSVLSISDQNVLELHRSFPLNDCRGQQLLSTARDFLNDLAWWKKQLQRRGQAPRIYGPDPAFNFSFNNWFPR